jgi:hypothetical protein
VLQIAIVVGLLALLAAGADASRPAPPPVALSPQPGTPDASPATQISVLGTREVRAVSVSGSRSGGHPGRLLAYVSEPGASFVPARRFVPGERVTVRLQVGSRSIRYRFTVAHPARIAGAAAAAASAAVASFVSRPDLHPPAVAVSGQSRAPGDVFVTPLTEKRGGLVGQFGTLIVDSHGSPIWVQPAPRGRVAVDLRPQTYLGRPVLTWWEGRVATPAGAFSGEDEIVDSTYRSVARVRAGNGYQADAHEFTLDPGGVALVAVYAPVQMDLSRVGGTRRQPAFDAVVQAIDVRTGLVMFEWHALGHVPLTDTHARASRRGPIFDPFHLNSIDVGGDGNLLISLRNTWAAYYVSRRSGRTLWQLGGRHSSFRFARGARFAWQHDVRLLPHATASVFDNEGTPRVGSQSRGIVLRLDARRHVATLARAYVHAPHVLAAHEGNVEALPGGGAFVGWGTSPYFSEFDAAGRRVLEGVLPGADESYRTYLAPWSGQPSRPPDVAVRPAGGGVTVYASWNGATDVASWQVLAGASPSSLAPVASAARTGFETAIAASGGPYFAVRALGGGGELLGTSQAVHE